MTHDSLFFPGTHPGRSGVWEPLPSGRGWQDLTQRRAGHASPTRLPAQALWDRKAFCSLVKGDVWNRVDSGPPHTSLGAAGLALGLGAPRTRHPGPAAGPTALTAGPAYPCPVDLQALVTLRAAEHPRPGVWALFCTAPGLARPPLMRPVPSSQAARQTVSCWGECRVGGHSPPTTPHPQRVWEWSWRPSPDSSPSWSPRLESPPELFLATRTCQQQDRRGRRGLAGRGPLAELWGETRGVSRPRRQQMPHEEPPQCVSTTEPVGSTGGGALGPDPGPGPSAACHPLLRRAVTGSSWTGQQVLSIRRKREGSPR